jgi:hypothetical protein
VQLRQKEAPIPEYLPGGHVTIVGDEELAVGQMYPALQSAHDPVPVPLYLPGAHDAAVGDVEPEMQ